MEGMKINGGSPYRGKNNRQTDPFAKNRMGFSYEGTDGSIQLHRRYPLHVVSQYEANAKPTKALPEANPLYLRANLLTESVIFNTPNRLQNMKKTLSKVKNYAFASLFSGGFSFGAFVLTPGFLEWGWWGHFMRYGFGFIMVGLPALFFIQSGVRMGVHAADFFAQRRMEPLRYALFGPLSHPLKPLLTEMQAYGEFLKKYQLDTQYSEFFWQGRLLLAQCCIPRKKREISNLEVVSQAQTIRDNLSQDRRNMEFTVTDLVCLN